MAESADVIVERRDALGRWLPSRHERGLVIYRGRNPGTAYPLEPHAAAWRSLGEIVSKENDLGTEADLAAINVADVVDIVRLRGFARTYGPLVNRDNDREACGRAMLSIALHFRDLAGYWDDPSQAEGISCRRSDSIVDRKAELAGLWVHALAKGDHPPPAGTLYEFMVSSALRHLQQEVPMRRCVVCNNWIELSRSDRLYCDTACRMARKTEGQRGRRRVLGEA